MSDVRWDPGGRSGLWRVATGVVGLMAIGAGAALVWHPRLLSYAVAATLGALGLLLVVSAIAARGPAQKR